MNIRFHKKNDKGQTLVEFAIILPIFLMFLFGIIQYGIIFSGQLIVSSAARDGARMAAVGKSDTDIKQAIVEKTALMPFLNIDSNTISVSPERLSRREGVDVIVQVPASIDIVMPMVGFLSGDEHSFSSTASMRYELTVPYQTETASEVYIDVFNLSKQGNRIKAVVGISDNYGNPIDGATVVIEISKDGETRTLEGDTESDGTYIGEEANFGSGYYTAEIISINAGSLTWNEISPEPGLVW